MVRFVLKYVYLVLGSAIAIVGTLGSINKIDQRADPDDDGVDERSRAAVRHEERRRLERGGEARSPMEAATYRANELVDRPLRTLLLLVGYMVVFVVPAVCISFTDRVASLGGPSVAPFVELLGSIGAQYLPGWVVPLLVPIAVVLGVLFPLVVHQSLKTAGDIRRRYST